MIYSVIPVERFIKEAKRLYKKYSSLRTELAELNETLARNPETGTPLGNNAYKRSKISIIHLPFPKHFI
jgi:hypothetical protein